MRIESLKLENFANYSNVEVSFDDNVTYLIGKNGAGKSTLGLNGVWFIMQGIAEKASKGGAKPLLGERFRFIGEDGKSAKGEMVLFDEKTNTRIMVSRKMTKDGSTLSFEGPDGVTLDQQWLNDLFNLFLISPKAFMDLSPIEQAKVLGINTSEFDEKIKSLKQEYTLINRDIKNIGPVEEVPEAKPVDVQQLNVSKNEIIKENAQIRKTIEDIEKHKLTLEGLKQEKNSLIERLKVLETSIIQWEQYIQSLPIPQEEKPMDEIDTMINNASEENKKYLEFVQYCKKKQDLEVKQSELSKNKEDQAQIVQNRLDYIKSKKLPFPELEIGEEGELTLRGKPIKEPFFSSGELIKIIPILVASQNPELKYVFIQNFNLLDEDAQTSIEQYLVGQGFQLVIELVGKKPVDGKHCIVLKDNEVLGIQHA